MADLSPLALTLGDPSGCGPAITIDAWTKLAATNFRFFVIGPPEIFSSSVPIEVIENPFQVSDVFDHALPVLPLPRQGPPPVKGKPHPDNARVTLQSIDKAIELARDQFVAGIVTNPINKSVLYDIGFNSPGHTEYIAEQLNIIHEPVMLLIAGRLRVALATIHIPLRQVAEKISVSGLVKTAKIVHNDLVSKFGITSPRLAFSGLNPHAGENGSIGKEELLIINPAAEQLRNEGINISDARPADTVFHEAVNGQYDAVIAMTHDQGLIPIKLHDFWNGVNCTLGLDIIRTSPDHGTAYQATLQGNLRSDSLIAAIKCAYSLAKQHA